MKGKTILVSLKIFFIEAFNSSLLIWKLVKRVKSSCILASSSMSLYSKKVEQPKFNEGFKGCTNIFQGKVAPLIMDKKISKNTYPICFTGFAVNYSGVSKTGLFSAEYITYDSLQKAKKINY